MKVGITGQNGFVGSHLFEYLKLQENISLIEFERAYFDNPKNLQTFVKECDVIVHLAALNRHPDLEKLYKTNVHLVQSLIDACETTQSAPHILISSSTQEEKDNLYGKSKKEGRELLEAWGNKNNASVTGMIIPNVFGPFGKPQYNSVVATFCHQIARNEEPTIKVDGLLKLIYVNDLVREIFHCVKQKKIGKIHIQHSYELKVSELLEKLNSFRHQYMDNGVFPSLEDSFDLALFNTFRCYIPNDYYPRKFTLHSDNRGSFVEITRANTSGQFSFSTTVPGITRGNHFHTRKAERFAVIKGKAKISLRRMGTEEVVDYFLDGENPAYVDMPIWTTHNITNIGTEELVTLFWINEPYNPEDPDTYFVNV